MTSRQKGSVIGVLGVAAMLACPPWTCVDYDSRVSLSAEGPGGYYPIWAAPLTMVYPSGTVGYKPDWLRLALQIGSFALLVVGGVIVTESASRTGGS